MFWTHFYDLIVKFGILFLSIFAMTSFPFYDDYAILLILTSLAISSISYIYFLRTLGSYLYCRFTLKMPVDFKQAEKLNAALSPNPFTLLGLEWLPLNEVKHSEADMKFERAIELLEIWTEQKKLKRQEQIDKFKNNSTATKIYEISLGLICVGLLLTSFFNVPPASYLISYYCELFDTNEYHPILIGCLMIIIFLLPILIIKKIRGVK